MQRNMICMATHLAKEGDVLSGLAQSCTAPRKNNYWHEANAKALQI